MKNLQRDIKNLPPSVQNVEKCLRYYYGYMTDIWEIQSLIKLAMEMIDTNLYYPTIENDNGLFFTNIIVGNNQMVFVQKRISWT